MAAPAKPSLLDCAAAGYLAAEDIERLQLALVEEKANAKPSAEALRRAACLRRLARTAEFVERFGEKKFAAMLGSIKDAIPEVPSLIETAAARAEAEAERVGCDDAEAAA